MKREYTVTLKRMLDGKPDIHTVTTPASNGVHAILCASRTMRRDGISNCSWTATRVVRGQVVA